MGLDVHPQEVHVAPLSLDRMRSSLDPDAWSRFEQGLREARGLLAGREVWNINSTGAGGGVAEMLRSWVGYARGIGIDMRWAAIGGTPEFFLFTKRLHNLMHGAPGDGGGIGKAEIDLYEQVTLANAEELVSGVREQDIVLLHDPQTAGMVPRMKQTGATVIWRCHIGTDQLNDRVTTAWEFLAPYVTQADACIFSRQAYVSPWTSGMPTAVVAPSIDILAPKNQEMAPDQGAAILQHVGLVVGDGAGGDVLPTFTRHDGSPGRVDRRCEVVSSGPPPAPDHPLVVQVSRWDRLKDPIGVMHGFAEGAIDATDSHLIIAGPTVHSVADDPDGAQVLDETERAWRELPRPQRSRVHLACIPMEDIEENAAIVNALQRHATVIVQKSLEEGFGLTVAEAMWKARPVVASAVGGISDQIHDGVDGILLQDPTDLEKFGAETLALLKDENRAAEIGRNAREQIRGNFLEDRHSLQYVELFKRLFGRPE